jgi:hypothetical protein
MEEEYGWVADPRPAHALLGPSFLRFMLAWRLRRPCRGAAFR